MKGTCAILALVGLAACATPQKPEPKVVTQDVRTAVATSCVPADTPPAPVYTDTAEALKAAPDFAARYQLLAAEHGRRITRADVLEAVVDACRRAAP